MKINEKKINGIKYLYLADYIYVGKGNSKLKNRSLGRVESIGSSIEIEIEKFKMEIINEEVLLRVNYWNDIAKNKVFKNYIKVSKIEDLRTKLYRSKDTMGELAEGLMDTSFMIDFIFNSNRIEGSKVPIENVERIVKSKRGKSNDEVTNSMKAINFINRKGFKLDIKNIQTLHSIILNHELSKHGYRMEPVIIGNSKTCEWTKVKPSLKKLIAWYKNASKTWYPPELAFEFHYKFERIHPFIDGNGRIGRLLMNMILKKHRYHPIIIWNKKAQSQINAFEKYMDGNGTSYYKYMTANMKKTYQIYLDKTTKAIKAEKDIKKFMRPSAYNFE